jgi:hypothetical protein
VEGSELHALTVEILVDRATPTHPHNRQAS